MYFDNPGQPPEEKNFALAADTARDQWQDSAKLASAKEVSSSPTTIKPGFGTITSLNLPGQWVETEHNSTAENKYTTYAYKENPDLKITISYGQASSSDCRDTHNILKLPDHPLTTDEIAKVSADLFNSPPDDHFVKGETKTIRGTKLLFLEDRDTEMSIGGPPPAFWYVKLKIE